MTASGKTIDSVLSIADAYGVRSSKGVTRRSGIVLGEEKVPNLLLAPTNVRCQFIKKL